MKKKKAIPLLFIVSLIFIIGLQFYGIGTAYNNYRLQFGIKVDNLLEQAVYINGEDEMGDLFLGGGMVQREIFNAGYARFGKLMTDLQIRGAQMTDAERDSLISQLFATPMIQAQMKFMFTDMINGSFKSDTANLAPLLGKIRTVLGNAGIDTGFEYVMLSPMSANEILRSSTSSGTYQSLRFHSKEVVVRHRGFVLQIGMHNNTILKYILREMSLIIISNLILVAVVIWIFFYLSGSFRNQEKLTRLKDDFVSNMSHELKTPVSTTRVILDALLRYDFLEDREKTLKMLTAADKELVRLSSMVDKILETSLFESGAMQLLTTPMDLKELLLETAQNMEPVLREQAIDFDLQLPGEAVIISADRNHIGNVINNLVDNAVKYRGPHPQIQVQLWKANGKAMITVADNGIGIPSEFREKIFERFFRVASGDLHATKGQGIGLFYVRQVLLKHRGNISVTSEQGMTIFKIEIPIHEATEKDTADRR